MNTLQRILLALLPLALTPLWGLLIAEGFLNFGGGEKDLLLLIPWLLWSFIYLVTFIILSVRKVAFLQTLVWACGIATAMLFVIWTGLYVFSADLLGVRSR